MHQKRNLIKSLDDDEIQIIGIEFTVETHHIGNQELAMFSPQGLIIPRLRPYSYYRPKITFHSTDGDYILIDYNGQCPW